MRVVDIDPNRTRSCQSLHYTTVGRLHLCTRGPTYHRYAAQYPSLGKEYSEVRGYAYGNQVRSKRLLKLLTVQSKKK